MENGVVYGDDGAKIQFIACLKFETSDPLILSCRSAQTDFANTAFPLVRIVDLGGKIDALAELEREAIIRSTRGLLLDLSLLGDDFSRLQLRSGWEVWAEDTTDSLYYFATPIGRLIDVSGKKVEQLRLSRARVDQDAAQVLTPETFFIPWIMTCHSILQLNSRVFITDQVASGAYRLTPGNGLRFDVLNLRQNRIHADLLIFTVQETMAALNAWDPRYMNVISVPGDCSVYSQCTNPELDFIEDDDALDDADLPEYRFIAPRDLSKRKTVLIAIGPTGWRGALFDTIRFGTRESVAQMINDSDKVRDYFKELLSGGHMHSPLFRTRTWSSSYMWLYSMLPSSSPITSNHVLTLYERAEFDPLRSNLERRAQRSAPFWDYLVRRATFPVSPMLDVVEVYLPFGLDASLGVAWLKTNPVPLRRLAIDAGMSDSSSITGDAVLAAISYQHPLIALQPDVVDEYIMDFIELQYILALASIELGIVCLMHTELEKQFIEALSIRQRIGPSSYDQIPLQGNQQDSIIRKEWDSHMNDPLLRQSGQGGGQSTFKLIRALMSPRLPTKDVRDD